MNGPRRVLLFTMASLLCGCNTARDVAVTSFRVIDAPANYVRRHIDNASPSPAPNTTAVVSDTVTPGRSVQTAPNAPGRQQPPATTQVRPSTTTTTTTTTTAPRGPQNASTEKPRSTPGAVSQKVTSPPAQYPTAKSVPGKPGYVFSPFDPSGGYVDVTGFASGSKVKDPYSGKIFLVP